MSYPLSADVAAGDITAASHYNNLRSDAMRLGNLAADSVNLGLLLKFFESQLTIKILGTTRIYVPASAAVPVSLVISGTPVQAVANVELALADAAAGAADDWYVFANKTAGTTTFTLSISTVSAEAANQRRLGQFYWNGTAIVKDSIITDLSTYIKDLLYMKEPIRQCGRLGLSTGDPVSADVASSATVYFTPYKGNRVSLYVPGYGWRVYSFTELTLDVSGFTNAKNYDIFLYDDAGTLKLEGVVWSNDTLRASALYNQDGVWVQTTTTGHLYLGTIRMSGAGTTADTAKARLVWNNYNRVNRQIKVIDTTDSWTYATTYTFRPMNNSTANRFEYVVGLVEEPLYISYHLSGENAAQFVDPIAGLGIDVTNVSSPTLSSFVSVPANYACMATAILNSLPLLGFHFVQLLESMRNSTITFHGDRGAPSICQTGATGWIIC
jgi:hypothetical protein